MPTLLGNKYNAAWLGVPIRMSPEDYEIWQRWRPLHKSEISELYFDVGLGGGSPVPDQYDEQMRWMWLRNTQKRADVVAVMGGGVEIIELRTMASENAVGRLLCYGMLWLDDPVIVASLRLRLVTDDYDADVERLCRLSRIIYEVI